MNEVVQMVGTFLLMAVTVISIENIVFTRAIGISRIISLVDNITSTVVFCSLLTVVTIVSGTVYYFLNDFFIKNMIDTAIYRVPAVVLVMSVTYIVIFIIAIKVMPYEHIGKAAEAMPTATFNCMVFGTILLATTEKLSLVETIIFCLGSAVGYTLAIILVGEGQRKLQSRDIPAAFKGLPCTLLYLAGIAMAIYGFTGRVFTN